MLSIYSFLMDSARDYPEKICIKDKGRKWTFSEVYQESIGLALKLKSYCVSQGDRVMIYLDNSVEYVISLFAVFCTNAVAVPVNNDACADIIQHIYNETAPKIVISNKALMSKLANGTDIHGSVLLEVGFGDGREEMKAASDLKKGRYCKPILAMPEAGDATPALLIFTSGTTKQPKGVTLSHRNIFANTESILQYLKLTPEDSVLATLRFTYSYGSSVLMTHIRAGGTIVIENRSAYPVIILEQLADTGVTGFSTLGSYLNRLLRQDTVRAEYFEHLRYVTLAGEKTDHEDIMRLRSLAPHIKIFNMYGQTEACARLSYLEPDLIVKKAGSIGKGIPGVTLRVVTEDGRDVMPGETGEVIAYGANIMMGYWNDEAGTREVIKDGWLYTGDLAEVDEDGYIYLKGRKDDIIKHLGYRISPLEIEAVINTCEDVAESAVVGVIDDPVTKIKAYVVAKHTVDMPDTEKILMYTRRLLPPFKRPQMVEFVKELPKTANGKIKRSALRKLSM
jgi:long-chain acyl-CoA synthetase